MEKKSEQDRFIEGNQSMKSAPNRIGEAENKETEYQMNASSSSSYTMPEVRVHEDCSIDKPSFATLIQIPTSQRLIEEMDDMDNPKSELDLNLDEKMEVANYLEEKDKKTRKPSFSIVFMKYMAQYLRKISSRNKLARFLRKKLKEELQNQIDATTNSSISIENPQETQREKQLYVFSIEKEYKLIEQLLDLKKFTENLDASTKVKNRFITFFDKHIHRKLRKVARVLIGTTIFQIKKLSRNGKKKTKRRRLIKELEEMCERWPATSLFPKLNYHAVMMENKRRVKIDKQPVLRNLFVKIAEVKRLEQENNMLRRPHVSQYFTSYNIYLKDKKVKVGKPINSWKRLIKFNMKRLLNTAEANPNLSRQLNEILHSNTITNMELTKIESEELNRMRRVYYNSLINLDIKRYMCKNNSYNLQFKRLIHDEGIAFELPPINPDVLHYVYIKRRLEFAEMVNGLLKLLDSSIVVENEVNQKVPREMKSPFEAPDASSPAPPSPSSSTSAPLPPSATLTLRRSERKRKAVVRYDNWW